MGNEVSSPSNDVVQHRENSSQNTSQKPIYPEITKKESELLVDEFEELRIENHLREKNPLAPCLNGNHTGEHYHRSPRVNYYGDTLRSYRSDQMVEASRNSRSRGSNESRHPRKREVEHSRTAVAGSGHVTEEDTGGMKERISSRIKVEEERKTETQRHSKYATLNSRHHERDTRKKNQRENFPHIRRGNFSDKN